MTRESTTGEITLRRAWERAVLRGHPWGHCARYGTIRWLRYPEDHPCRFAAVVRAAACWESEGDGSEIAARFSRELRTEAAVWERIEDEEFATMAAGIRRLANA